MDETWRPVPSLPGISVSSQGRVMHDVHEKPMPKGGVRTYGGTPTLGVWNKQDARYIFIIGRKHSYKVARLVAEAFHGPPPFEGAVVMHLDENAANNRADNLQWGTQKENLNARRFLEYCSTRTGENNPFIKGKLRRESEPALSRGK
jgi:HNH endonuclease